MKHVLLSLFSIIIISGCTKKTALVNVTASVTITKQVDTVPCQLYVEYFDITNGATNQTISSSWNIVRNLHSDQYATLKVTSVSNVKNFVIELSGVGTTVTKNGIGNNSTIDIRKNMYE